MGFGTEFKAFAMKGNVIDLAVGVIIGAAFGKIVDSVVKDLIMPLANLATSGQIDYSNKYWVLSGKVPDGATLLEAQKVGNVLAYGNFVTIAINFIILAFVIFMMIRQINKMKRAEPATAPVAPAATPEDVLLLREIRDLLNRR
jgi:large conductance mechanosensitive channel